MTELFKLWVNSEDAAISIENQRELFNHCDRPLNFSHIGSHLQLLGDRLDHLGVGVGPVHPAVPLLDLLHLDVVELLLERRLLVDLEQQPEREDEVELVGGSLEVLDGGGEAGLGKQIALLLEQSLSLLVIACLPQCGDPVPLHMMANPLPIVSLFVRPGF